MKNLINFTLCLGLIVLGSFIFLQIHGTSTVSTMPIMGIASLGVIGIWRWSQFLYRLLRSWYYQACRFPRWRQVANAVPIEALLPLCLIVPTYKEKNWITERVFRSIVQEAYTLKHPLIVFVSSSSDAENEAIQDIVASCDPENRVKLILRTQQHGKRKAMADGLRELARMGISKDTVVALMDGDSELAPGVLRKSLPFFLLFPKMGGLTTDEIPKVYGSYIFSEWFHLRFVQRHFQMCADSLSQKVLCLTGRFSLFRGEAAFHPDFADQLEFDHLDDWLWGRFKFLSGDDKSTWFWLLKHRYDMLYVPDALVYSIETVSDSIVDRAIANMRRWFGNMLRNNSRALALGPKVIGWSIWYALIDQRLSIWTALISPSVLVLALIQADWYTIMAVTSWIFITRPLMLMLLFIGRKSDLKPVHFFLLVMMQWGAPLIKISVQMNLAQQKWANRGNQSINVGGSTWSRWIKRSIARFMIGVQVLAFGLGILLLGGQFRPWDTLRTQRFFQEASDAQTMLSTRTAPR